MNQNTFAQNITELTDTTNNAISALSLLSETYTSDSDVVTTTINNETISMPSYNNILKRLNTVERTVDAFTSGNGSVKLLDGTNRQIKVSTMPSTPTKMTNFDKITTFGINTNWFFEDLMYPKMVVKIDLKDKVASDSDRIKIMRIIIDYSNNRNSIEALYNNEITNILSYSELLHVLDANGVSYYEDEEILEFPLIQNEYIGNFKVIKREIISGNVWYYLDNMYYTTNVQNINNINNIELKKNDTLIYKQSLYKIEEIDYEYNRVRLSSNIGFDSISVDSLLKIYNDPFRSKVIEIPVGINEINCVFLKGINEDYNLLSDEWSDMISFKTNDLLYEDNNKMSFEVYYNTYIADFGADWIAQAKERKISAYKGQKPNSVVLDAADFRVVQINTQINSVLDDNEVKNTQSNIVNLQSNIKSLRNTIAKQKNDLLAVRSKTDNNDKTINKLHEQINTNTKKLESSVTEYVSNVEFLNNKLKDVKYNITSPKYRIRGFFPIPELKYYKIYNETTNSETIDRKEDIIGFEIRYRYLRPDSTGTNLATFDYTNKSNKVTAVFSDWNIVNSIFKNKVYNELSGVYEWQVENAADGSEININQIDIPITKGEKVEFCVRAISEAGYPENPLKSDWSNSVIIEFPESLAVSDQISNIIDDVNSEMTSIKLEDTLKSAGYYSHINDEIIVNKNSDQIQYHHDSKNILCDISINGNVNNSIYDVINNLLERIKALESK